MGIINVLDTQTANLIAAGEVVERPASVVKEFVENSIDAGARKITVEIKNGGVTYIRVSDDGSGMTPDDARACILRHATSKISSPEDLSGIATLGFRGEALAAISSVCRLTVMTKRREDADGTVLKFTPETGAEVFEAGCPDGTTMIAEDIFYNVPARRKFLKRDFSEAMAVGAVVERLAVSHPEISVKFISDNKVKYTTMGDGELSNAVYTVFGSEFHASLIPVNSGYNMTGIGVSGFICKPECGRSNRNMQYMFLNGRTVRSKTACAALEEAYRTYMPEGNFPTCVLFLSADFSAVDVNVHPTKQEVKFANEKDVFDAVYYAAKNTIENAEDRPTLSMRETGSYAERVSAVATSFVPVTPAAEKNPFSDGVKSDLFKAFPQFGDLRAKPLDGAPSAPVFSGNSETIRALDVKADENEKASELLRAEQKPDYRLIGEAYNCYIFVELSDRVMVIDKHAAHERILYNEIIKDKASGMSQTLLVPVTVTLSSSEMAAVSEYIDDLNAAGFETEIFGSDSLLVRAVPVPLSDCDIASVLTALAGSLSDGKGRVSARNAVYERALFTAACKAAMKGGQHTNAAENSWIVEKVLSDNAVRFCPHGRPVAYEIKKSSLENQFGR